MQFFACKDYVETDIEGQWQLNKVVYAGGREEQVDTVFYSFKKDVFRYLKLLNEDDTFTCFGSYSRDGDKLKVRMPRGTVNDDLSEGYFDWGVENRSFIVKKHTSKVLELESEDKSELLVLRKY